MRNEIRFPNAETAGWVIALALLFSGMDRGLGDALTGGLIGFLVAFVLYLSRRTDQLSRQVTTLEAGQLAAGKTSAPKPAPEPASPPAFEAADSRTWHREPPQSVTEPDPAPRAQPASPLYIDRTAAPAPSALDRWLKLAMAWFTRGNPLARVGIVILFFGGAFLAKYAAEHTTLSLQARFVGIALVALALLAVGLRLRVRNKVYAQILQGGGIAGLYLTVFAATRLYDLLPTGVALALLVVVAIVSAILAVWQNALALAVIGTAGGFMAPILVSTGSSNHVALFTYYTVLNAGVFAVAWFRNWRELNWVGLLFTFGITGLFRGTAYSVDKLVSTDFFLLLFFLMYVGVSILSCIPQPPKLRGYLSGSLVFGLPVVVVSLHGSMVSHIEYALAWSSLGFGVFYLALAWALHKTAHANFRLLVESFGALGVIFTSLAIPLAFDQQTTTAMWAIEGAGMIWIGLRLDRKLPRALGALLQVAGGIGFLGHLHHQVPATPLLNAVYIGSTLLAIGGILSGWWLYRERARLAAYESSAALLATVWGLAWWLGGGLNELREFIPVDARYGLALAFGALSSLALFVLSRRLAWPLAAQLALLLLPGIGTAGLLATVGLHHPLANLGWVGWTVLVAATGFMLHRSQDEPPLPDFEPWLHAGALWLLAILGIWELDWRIDQVSSGVWDDLAVGLVPALLVFAVARTWPPWPLARHTAAYALKGAVPLVALCIVWIVTLAAGNAGDAYPLPYIPLLNPLDISMALVLAALLAWWLSLDDGQRESLLPAPHTALGIGAALGFIWLTTSLLRSLHHLADVPWTFESMRHSFLVQASLSLFWGALGWIAMSLATRRKERTIWMAGATLMGVVVAKLFLVDLAGSGTLARIVSFLGVGGLLLLAGYTSPLPPRRAVEVDAQKQ